MLTDGTAANITKKERLRLSREKAKLEKVLGGIASLNRIPAAIFLVDIMHEHIALAEAKKLGIQTIGMVDTNSDPTQVDFAIPANDDATKSIAIITSFVTESLMEGINERQKEKDSMEAEEDDVQESSREFGGEEEEAATEGEKRDRRAPGKGGGGGGGLRRRQPRGGSSGGGGNRGGGGGPRTGVRR